MSRTHATEPVDLVLPSRLRRGLTVGVLLVIAAAILGIVSTWPGTVPVGSPAQAQGDLVHGVVVSAHDRSCPGQFAEDRLPDGTMPTTVECPEAVVQTDDGTRQTVIVPPATFHGGLGAGDRVVLTHYPADVAGQDTWVFSDVDRRLPLAVTVGVFVLLTVLVARRRGVVALLGLGLGAVAIGGYVLPALLTRQDAVVVGLSATTAVMAVVAYLTHGFSTRTTVAFLGTVAGLLLTAAAAVLAVGAARLTGLDDETAAGVTALTGAVDLRGVVLAGALVAALGLLNDVTITQAAAVWELRAADPGAGFARLFGAGMRIGRDHLASTVYTVAFAYAGAALPTLMFLRLYPQPFGGVIGSTAVAEEIVRTAVGGAVLALTVPLTTALAAALVLRSRPHPDAPLAVAD
ncbi:YibE/F family protein [Kineococcus gynurae]|uniref:YibE/F family protein n=1 Tax=Kineococcus gynurae TaxID=452979 RepID=A0ABV5LUW3_9ACTN